MYKDIFTSKNGHFEIYFDTDHWGFSINFNIDDSEDVYAAITGRHIIEVRILLLNIVVRF